MAIVALDFAPPAYPGFVKLNIYELDSPVGTPTLIETVNDIGTYPSYITRYTTNFAVDALDWFAVDFEDDKGAKTLRSIPMQGGTTSAVAIIVSRVILRDPTIDENVAIQESEGVIRAITGQDPYVVDTSLLTADQLSGMTFLTMARSYIGSIITSGSESDYVAGLVSQKSSSTVDKKQKLIEWLIDQANVLLGTNFSVVMLLEDFDPTGLGTATSIEVDQSRLILEIE